jgi:hypothetical protein
MAFRFPARRILRLPARFWVVLPFSLIGLGYAAGMLWPPDTIAEPPDRARIFREPILAVRAGNSFRIVSVADQQGIKPIWAVNVNVMDIGNVSWETHSFVPGLFRRESRWIYDLTAHRDDADWRSEPAATFILPEEGLSRLRPLVVAELNRRDPTAHMGDRLDKLLTVGLPLTSYVSPQNGLILLGWLSLPMALVGLVSMFIPPRAAPAPAKGDILPGSAT